MGSGAKGNSTGQNVAYSFQAQNAIDKQDWNAASMWLGMIDDPFTSVMVQKNLNDAQQKYNDEQMAKQKADFDRQMKELKQATQQQEATSQETINANQKAYVTSINNPGTTGTRSNSNNLTGGTASGASTARKTLQGFGGKEDMQDGESWY